MTKKPNTQELIARCEELGIEVPEKHTNPMLAKLIAEAEAAQAAEAVAEAVQAASDAAEAIAQIAEAAGVTAEAADLLLKRVSCEGFHALNVRKEPSKQADVVGELFHGDEVEVESSDNGWAKVDGGYCMEQYLD